MSSPPTSRRAVIDVGANSVKVLVGDMAAGGSVGPVLETSEQTRLGRGLYATQRLQSEAITATAAALGNFVRLAREYGATTVRVVATSAARDAQHRDELLAALLAAGGIRIEVISGETEADWAFAGVCSAPASANSPLLVLDVGGGSREFILGTAGQPCFRRSFQPGSVRMLEQLQPGDCPTPAVVQQARQRLKEFIGGEVVPALTGPLTEHPPSRVVGVGGSTSILAMIRAGTERLDRAVIESTRFGNAELSELVERLWSLPLAERHKLPGLPPERADVILVGAAIYEAILRTCGYPELSVSTRGLRYAALVRP
jgi:exopolyphosphatase/guanosine-5'-triphosphate,3'-diphosphate pyrophosphatase